MNGTETMDIVAINSNTPRGEMTNEVLIKYGIPIDHGTVDVETYSVQGRKIKSVDVTDDDNVLIRLVPDYKKGITRKMVGFGQNAEV